jgi:hypothetical protein
MQTVRCPLLLADRDTHGGEPRLVLRAVGVGKEALSTGENGGQTSFVWMKTTPPSDHDNRRHRTVHTRAEQTTVTTDNRQTTRRQQQRPSQVQRVQQLRHVLSRPRVRTAAQALQGRFELVIQDFCAHCERQGATSEQQEPSCKQASARVDPMLDSALALSRTT